MGPGLHIARAKPAQGNDLRLSGVLRWMKAPEHLHAEGRKGDGELYNVEFETFNAAKDLGKIEK